MSVTLVLCLMKRSIAIDSSILFKTGNVCFCEWDDWYLKIFTLSTQSKLGVTFGHRLMVSVNR